MDHRPKFKSQKYKIPRINKKRENLYDLGLGIY